MVDIPADAPDCGLYVRIEPGYNFESMIAHLRDLFFIAKLSRYQFNMHVLELPGANLTPDMEDEIRGMTGYARQSGFVAIIRGNATRAKDWEADGVLLDDMAGFEAARALLGSEAIIGLRCGESRERAEEALRAGADYVSFHAEDSVTLPSPALLGWWATGSALPCLVEGQFTPGNCDVFVQAGASFIDATDAILRHPTDVKQATADMLAAIDRALDKRLIS